MQDRSEMRKAFIGGYIEGGGKQEKLDETLAMFGFRTTAEEARAKLQLVSDRGDFAERADYDDSEGP